MQCVLAALPAATVNRYWLEMRYKSFAEMAFRRLASLLFVAYLLLVVAAVAVDYYYHHHQRVAPLSM